MYYLTPELTQNHRQDFYKPVMIDPNVTQHRFANLAVQTPFDDRFERMLAATWFPNQIPMSQDSADYRILSELEQHLFSVMISYLNWGDYAVPNNITTYFNLISRADIAKVLNRISGDEALHTHSYKYILESIITEPLTRNAIYGKAMDYKPFLDKINWNIGFTNRLATAIHTTQSTDKIAIAFYEDLVAYYIFENVFFPAGLSTAFCMASGAKGQLNSGRLLGVANQYKYILRDEREHAGNVLAMIKMLMVQFPILKSDAVIKRAKAIFNDAYNIEAACASVMLPDGGLPYLATSDYLKHVEHLLKLTASSIGVDLGIKTTDPLREILLPYFTVAQTNPQETSSTNYSHHRITDDL